MSENHQSPQQDWNGQPFPTISQFKIGRAVDAATGTQMVVLQLSFPSGTTVAFFDERAAADFHKQWSQVLRTPNIVVPQGPMLLPPPPGSKR